MEDHEVGSLGRSVDQAAPGRRRGRLGRSSSGSAWPRRGARRIRSKRSRSSGHWQASSQRASSWSSAGQRRGRMPGRQRDAGRAPTGPRRRSTLGADADRRRRVRRGPRSPSSMSDPVEEQVEPCGAADVDERQRRRASVATRLRPRPAGRCGRPRWSGWRGVAEQLAESLGAADGGRRTAAAPPGGGAAGLGGSRRSASRPRPAIGGRVPRASGCAGSARARRWMAASRRLGRC